MLVGWEKRSYLTRIQQLRSAIPALCLAIRRGAHAVLHSCRCGTQGVSSLERLLTAAAQNCSCPRRRTKRGPGESIEPAVSGTPDPGDVENKTSTSPAATCRADRFRTEDLQTVRKGSCASGPQARASSVLAPIRSTPATDQRSPVAERRQTLSLRRTAPLRATRAAIRPTFPLQPAPAKRSSSPGDAPTTTSGSVSCRVRFPALAPPSGDATRPARSASKRRAAQRSDRAGFETELNSQQANAEWTGRGSGTWKTR